MKKYVALEQNEEDTLKEPGVNLKYLNEESEIKYIEPAKFEYKNLKID